MCQAVCFCVLWSIDNINKNNLILLTSRLSWFKLANSSLFCPTAVVPCLCYTFFDGNLDFNWQEIIIDYVYFIFAFLILLFSLRNSRLHDETRDDTCAAPMIRFLWHGLRFESINELLLFCLIDLIVPFFRLDCSILLEYLFILLSFIQFRVQRECASLEPLSKHLFSLLIPSPLLFFLFFFYIFIIYLFGTPQHRSCSKIRFTCPCTFFLFVAAWNTAIFVAFLFTFW